MSFDPKAHLIRVQGGQMYLPVAWRLVWFREQHPEWGIATEVVEINHEQKYAIFRASIFNENGRLIATATKREDVRGFGDYIEKAETSSVGRALAMCGYGTQFCGSEFDESERLADAPQAPTQPAKLHKPDAAQYQQRTNAPHAPQRRYDAPMSPPGQPAPVPAKQAVDDFLGDPDALFQADEVTTKPARPTNAVAGGL